MSQGLPIEVCYFYTSANDFPEKENYQLLAPFDTPLRQSILKIPPLAASCAAAGDEQNKLDLVCKKDNFQGEDIDLNQMPIAVDYIVESLRSQTTPILYVSTSVVGRHDSGISVSGPSMLRRASQSAKMLKSVLHRTSLNSSSDSENEVGPIRETIDSTGPKSISVSPELPDSLEAEDVFSNEAPYIRKQKTTSNVRTSPTKKSPLRAGTSLTLMPVSTRHSNIEDRRSCSMDDDQGLFDIIQNGGSLPHANTLGRLQPPNVEPAQQLPYTGARSGKIFVTRAESLNKRKRRTAFRKKRASTLDLNIQQLTLQVTTDSGYQLEIPFHSHQTVGELKHSISKELLSVGQLPGNNGLTLTYSLPSNNQSEDGDKSEGKSKESSPPKVYELVDDLQLLTNTLFLQQYDSSEGVVEGLRVGPTRSSVHKDLVTIYRITQLSRVILDERVTELGGADLKEYTVIAQPDRDEMEAARRTLHDYVMQVTSQRSTENYVLSVDIARDAAPTTLILKVPFNNQVVVIFHYKKVFSLTKNISIHQTASSVLRGIHHCLTECDLIKNSVEAYTMQMSGVNSYIHGNYELIAFADIRRCIVKKEEIHLSVLSKPSSLMYEPFEISWHPVDPFSYKPPLQVDVSEAYRRETISIWEYPQSEEFKLKLVKVENLPFDAKNLLLVELSIHHGSSIIHSPRTTSIKAQDSFTMTWNEEIQFITALRDIPKAAKVLVTVRSSSSGVYYWGLINIFNHHSMIRTGSHTLNMWEVKGDSVKLGRRTSTAVPTPIVEKEKEAFSSILSGPAANNPSTNAVRVVLDFGSYEKPVYYPSACMESRKKLFSQHPAYRNATLKKHFHVYKGLKFNMRSNKQPYHNLPVHIESIKWRNISERLEVYDVLDTIMTEETMDESGSISKEIDKIPLYVAFRLLDKDFPDDKVRAFATKIVESKVTGDTLEDYLLQLTQAIKFEHSHDSPLARYLLKQALMNKNIGHTFFWYLRSEMQSPQYTLRFAVILEAYLKGCGEALLTKYMDHITMQDSLETIGQKLKDTYGRDSKKMTQVLPGELFKAELHKINIIPTYNPRLRLGSLIPEHCKVMGSAKKPLFLEMLNVNSTALKKDPVRLIMKMGDDLRQDMITLKMLSLFEKLWENDGLDLKLIPYGCIATGPRSGFIEVVRNSKTIAEVSGVRENKKLYEWIKQHQKDEYGEDDPEKLKQAIDTFVHSCAGYSVATYILGIGDRHNDNIMITTSGNLFHIDFGHFLGNIKHFMTFKREWAPFVLTPDFTYVMGGEDSASFRFYKHLCIRAFLILRRNADLIINLFSMMRSTGIPELTCVEDIDYIKMALAIEKNDTEAEREFQTIIKKCLDLRWTVQVMWALHKLRVTSPKAKKN